MQTNTSQADSASGIQTGAKFFFRAQEKFLVRGVTYGTFQPSVDSDYPAPEIVARDFALMRAAAINTVRIYTAPPLYLLDEAQKQGLQVIVGLAWTQHVCFLDEPQLQQQIRRKVQAEVRACAQHPAVLAFAIGNEIPAPIVRWHGKQKIEQFLRQLYDDVKRIAPRKLVTYVNYPPTDYLDLSFLDFVCFNVFLHRAEDFRAYLAKLQNIAGNRSLLLTEIGMDSLREGDDAQARFLDWQLHDAFVGGVAGVCVFAWTDDWYRGGHQIEDWAFGLVDVARQPKPAYEAVRSRLAQLPFAVADQQQWPKVSVVICAYNAASTLEDCLSSLQQLRYPNYEVIIVNDGSTDATPAIAARYPFELISVPNGGLSAARNLGLHAATGEIVAYTDADTRVDEDWLAYLVQPFLTMDVVGVGGPNVVPSDDDWIAQCVARSPGGPTQVLLNDVIAEHIPGCNMAFRKAALLAIGGFDTTFTKAGDDVDICWRLQARGGQLAFSPAALVWHHHRHSVKAYWRQQVGYGEGESFLAQRHPTMFNDRGQTRWQGRIYSPLPAYRSLFKAVIYHGRWGAAAFPSVSQGGVRSWDCLPQMIEWQVLTMLFFSGAVWQRWLLIPALLALAATIWRCVAHALATNLNEFVAPDAAHWRYRAMIAWLHYLQPWARLRGRLKGAWGKRAATEQRKVLSKKAPPLSWADTLRLCSGKQELLYWDTRYTDLEALLGGLYAACKNAFGLVHCDDGWQHAYDLQLRVGAFGWVQLKVTAEDHGGLNRLFRVRIKPQWWWQSLSVALLVTVLGWALSTQFQHGLAMVLSTSLLVGGLLLRTISQRFGQLVAVLESVCATHQLHSLANRPQNMAGEAAPAFEK